MAVRSINCFPVEEALRGPEHAHTNSWDGVYIGVHHGIAYLWVLVGLDWNPETGKVDEKWVWKDLDQTHLQESIESVRREQIDAQQRREPTKMAQAKKAVKAKAMKPMKKAMKAVKATAKAKKAKK